MSLFKFKKKISHNNITIIEGYDSDSLEYVSLILPSTLPLRWNYPFESMEYDFFESVPNVNDYINIIMPTDKLEVEILWKNDDNTFHFMMPDEEPHYTTVHSFKEGYFKMIENIFSKYNNELCIVFFNEIP